MKELPDLGGQPETELTARTLRLNELNRDLTNEIARLKEAEQACARENDGWVQIFDAVSDLIMIVDDRHRILRINKAMADALEMPEEQILGRTCFELVHGEKECPDFCPHKRLLGDGKAHSEVVVEPRLGGTYDVRVFPLLDRNGQRLNSVHVARDISTETVTQEKIQQQSEFLTNVLNSLTHQLYVIDANDYTIMVANRAAELSGVTVGRKCYAASHGISDPCSGPEHPCPVLEVKTTGKPVTVEHIHIGEDGTPRNLEVYAYPIKNAEGEVLQVIEYALDVTERKRTEEALERRVIALTRPLDEAEGIAFEDLFNLDEIQKLQDQFARAVGVASLIVRADGTPITKPSNFCRLCAEVIRKTEKGLSNCIYSDSMIGRYNFGEPIIQPCLSAGLRNAGSSITVGGRHIANWLIGQVREDSRDEDSMRTYARTIGADEETFMKAYHEVPTISEEHFKRAAQAVFSFAQQLSTMAYQNVQQARFISERKAAEEALRNSEEKLRLFINHAPTALAMFDSEMRYLAVSKRWMQDYRLGYRDVIGRSHFDFFPGIPDQWKEVYRRGLRGEVVRSDEERIERKRGGPQWLRWEVRPWYTAEGAIGGIVIFTEDITGRKQAEEARLRSERRYKNLFDESRDGIFFVRGNGEIIDANPSFLDLFGFARKEMIGKNVNELLFDLADRSLLLEEINKVGFVKDYEIRLRRKDGTEVDCLLTASVQSRDDGSIAGYRGILRDLTIRKRLQNQLFQAQKMEAIGTLAGGIAHDFNNLLQVILGYTDLLITQKGKKSPDFITLKAIRKAAKDGGHLVKGLLTFSRRAESTKVLVNLTQQLQRLGTLWRRMIPKTIEIELFLDQDLNAVNADPIQLEQALMNLVINAHHAMPEGGKLTIEGRNVTLDEDWCRIHVEAKPGEFVMLKVSDTGFGMETEVVERIFEPFFTLKGAGEGTGLGLSIVYGIVKNHDGYITCFSEPGLGATFSIYLPAVTEVHVPDIAITTTEMTAFGTETILLVDDEQPIRDSVEHTLASRGYKVLSAANGNKALEIYREKAGQIDLIILDLNMPGMSGGEVLEAILNMDPGAKILIASGYSVNESMKRKLEVRPRGFISKPFDGKEILRAVRGVLDEAGHAEGAAGAFGPASPRRPESEGSLDTKTPPSAGVSEADRTFSVEGSQSRLRILAIDDREPLLRMLEFGLHQFGHKPLIAFSGIEGLYMFRETVVDLVVCDLGMPEMDGWEVARTIKEICQERGTPKTPFILMTGESTMGDINLEVREKMVDCGVEAIIVKPVDIPDLLEIVERLAKRTADGRE